MDRSATMAGAASVALVMVICLSQAAQAAPFIGGTNDWVLVGKPTAVRVGISPAIETTFDNQAGVTMLGIVIMVLRNPSGQMVYFSTATLNITRGLSGSAYTIEFGLTSGRYTATIFAISTAGVAISNATTTGFSV